MVDKDVKDIRKLEVEAATATVLGKTIVYDFQWILCYPVFTLGLRLYLYQTKTIKQKHCNFETGRTRFISEVPLLNDYNNKASLQSSIS